MKFLLTAINAKYIHSNLGVYSLKSYAKQYCADAESDIEIGEYTINQQQEFILRDIYRRKPDAVGFSCYIWNISYVKDLIRDLHQILPEVHIWLGGPEVSFNSRELLEEFPELTGIMMGEGEETFAQLIQSYAKDKPEFYNIEGIAAKNTDGSIVLNKIRPVMDLSRIPFSYGNLEGFEHRIIYYESSRGCPFACSYCLSSIDKAVRFRNLELVKVELAYFLEKKVHQVKFVDRTFNCKKSHSQEIWKFIQKHDNGITNFHFEISADLLDTGDLNLIKSMRPGLIQLEIGVQTTNPHTIDEIRRKMDLNGLKHTVSEINSFHNTHQHLDLIAGLPFEDYESFTASFNEVYQMNPNQLQLGFLKVLKGSHMADMVKSYGLKYQSRPPYEVLSTKWLGYEEIIRLKAVEEMVEVYYNSGQFKYTLEVLKGEFETPFHMFQALASEYDNRNLFGLSHNRLARYEILYEFICSMPVSCTDRYRSLLMYDLYLRENVKSRPVFATDQSPYKTLIRNFFITEACNPSYLKGYEGYDRRQMSKMAHIEVMEDGSYILFDYLNRDLLDHNAKATILEL